MNKPPNPEGMGWPLPESAQLPLLASADTLPEMLPIGGRLKVGTRARSPGCGTPGSEEAAWRCDASRTA